MAEFITGNQAVVRGAVLARCDFFAGYPITPASSVLTEMIRALRDMPHRVVQTEDEIAAIGQCIGAAMAGARAMTATSGPGMSLYSENIGLAIMGEVPLVIVDCQRMGPATGGATATGEGDVMFARHGTSGGYPIPVLAASCAESAFWLTVEAFNMAEELRSPVVLLTSKDIALTRRSVDLGRITLPEVRGRVTAASDEGFVPYRVAAREDIPCFSPIGGSHRVRFTGSIHDERGELTIDPGAIAGKLEHLHAKVLCRARSLERVHFDLEEGAETLLITYGGTDGAAREAVAELRAGGVRVSHLTLFTLFPLPREALRKAVRGAVRVIVAELNIGLYVDALRPLLPGASVESLVRFDGGLISPEIFCDRVCASPAERFVARKEPLPCNS